jgi:hypothetical protein
MIQIIKDSNMHICITFWAQKMATVTSALKTRLNIETKEQKYSIFSS